MNFIFPTWQVDELADRFHKCYWIRSVQSPSVSASRKNSLILVLFNTPTVIPSSTFQLPVWGCLRLHCEEESSGPVSPLIPLLQASPACVSPPHCGPAPGLGPGKTNKQVLTIKHPCQHYAFWLWNAKAYFLLGCSQGTQALPLESSEDVGNAYSLASALALTP